MNQKALIIFVAVLASLLEIIDTSIVNVAIPTMMGNLGATIDEISMIITGYAIANAVVLPVSSWLSERIGRRPYYLGCILAFTATSVACGLAPNLTTLIIFRIFQGLMGGALLPTSQALIYEQFPPEKAGIAGAIFGMSVMIGPTLGPVLGGFLTDEYGWRSIFNINLPLGILAFLVGSAVIWNRKKEAHEQQGHQKFDAVGLALLVAGIGCLQYVLERGEANDWFDSQAICFTTFISLACLPLFLWWENRVKHPIINVKLFLSPIVQDGVLMMSFLGFYLYGVVFLLPIFVVRTFHFDATQTGMLFIPGSILTGAMMPFIGKRMHAGTSPKLLIAVGFVCILISLYMMTLLSPLSTQNDLLAVLFMRGFAMAFLFVPINSSILSQFKGATLGQVSGLLNLFRQLGGSIGIALVSTLLIKNSHQNYLDLASNISALNPFVQANFWQNKLAFAHKFSTSLGFGNGTSAAYQSLDFRIQNQVFMLSFQQLIWFIFLAFSLAFFPIYRLKIGKKIDIVDPH